MPCLTILVSRPQSGGWVPLAVQGGYPAAQAEGAARAVAELEAVRPLLRPDAPAALYAGHRPIRPMR